MTELTTAPQVDPELDWIQLRKELRELEEKDKDELWYKHNWYVHAGLLSTAGFLFYGVLNMHHPTKWVIGAYGRIGAQFVTAVAMSVGFFKYANDKSKKMKERLEPS